MQGIADDKKLPIERVRDAMYPGLTQRLVTADDAEMILSYGTSADIGIEDETHTGTQVRIGAYGPAPPTSSDSPIRPTCSSP